MCLADAGLAGAGGCRHAPGDRRRGVQRWRRFVSPLHPATLIPGHCPIPAPRWEQPVGKARHRRPADIRPSVCEDRLAGAGPVSGPEIGASAGHSAAPAPAGSFCPPAICIPGGRLGPLLLGAASWRRAAAEAALGSSPPALNGTFVGEPGSSSGLAGTCLAPSPAVSPGVGGLCLPAMSSPSRESTGMLQRGWDVGGCSPGLASPMGFCCWGGLC